MVRRAGARPGDLVMVTGTIGDAALGLVLRHRLAANRRDPGARREIDAAMRDHLLARYFLPRPRTAIAAALRGYASAALDVSDGLAGDLGKLCRVSDVAAAVAVVACRFRSAERQALASDPAAIETILTGGDDFEIVATSVVPTGSKALPAGRRGGGRRDHADRHRRAGTGREIPHRRRQRARVSAAVLQPFLKRPKWTM